MTKLYIAGNSGYEVLMPKIKEVSLTPNPVNQNSSLLVAVSITEETAILPPQIIYNGTFYSGEERGNL